MKHAKGTLNKKFVPAKPNQLQVDIDDKRSLSQMWNALRVISDSMQVEPRLVEINPSKTNGHKHVTITLNKSLPLIERIALQSMLGSDYVREIMNWGRYKNKHRHPVLFLEK